ncbi:MAG: permease [Oscillospiraceae bacterium]|nr:permease [Oscillospiraceae bacterium]
MILLNNTISSIAEHTHDHDHVHGGVQGIINYLAFDLLKFDDHSKMIEFITTIIGDFLQIILMLFIVISLISYFQTFSVFQNVIDRIKKNNSIFGIIPLIIIGLFSSTCMCTALPIFIGLISVKIPLYLSISFLISGALLNLTTIGILLATTSLEFTITYIIVSISIIIITSIILKFVDIKYNINISDIKNNTIKIYTDNKSRLLFVKSNLRHSFNISIIYIILGVLLSGIIKVFVDLNFMTEINNNSFLFILMSSLAGLVVHMEIASLSPIIHSMYDLGINYSIIISFIISTVFFSIPSLIILKKYIKIKYQLYIWSIIFILILLSGIIVSNIT